MLFCSRKIFHRLFFSLLGFFFLNIRHVFINLLVCSMEHMCSMVFKAKSWWWATQHSMQQQPTELHRTKHLKTTEQNREKTRTVYEFQNFPHHAFTIHQRLSWNKTERATCHKMLVCHKIHWIIVAVIVAKKTDLLWDLFIAFTNLLACVSELTM